MKDILFWVLPPKGDPEREVSVACMTIYQEAVPDSYVVPVDDLTLEYRTIGRSMVLNVHSGKNP